MQQYQETQNISKMMANKMRMGSGVSSILQSDHNPTHYQDSLERFQKDFASFEKARRQDQKQRRYSELEKKRLEYLERQNNRWEKVENQLKKKQQREELLHEYQRLGIKRTANSNGLAYNPINLEYQKNPEGEKLRLRDEDHQIRGYVRAHNMDFRGNSKYNPLTGADRIGIEKVIPQNLNERFENKLYWHYDNMKIKVPASSNSIRPRNYFNYY